MCSPEPLNAVKCSGSERPVDREFESHQPHFSIYLRFFTRIPILTTVLGIFKYLVCISGSTQLNFVLIEIRETGMEIIYP